ncbi:hypothetical protein V6Z11_D11G199800 [Gossypium hirsutum]|uniref:Uncharacterized protein isoform X1 n=1 Tax=Gossypium hirsutum TaxID=3635 RepID=A0ABM3B5T0_GOSHI|nr:uncharacterized protein LOC107913027 isoform X1 [Gossypium hirsutum]
MSALPASVSSSSSWIPEDDLLLKNAIESGASLEALAKGAVRFSRKFTVKELQDRWRALLYDPVISDQAAARMIEVELSASNLYSKSSKCDNSVENGSAKRKFESVRRSYYAMRKRACNYHVTNSSGVSFLGSPNGNDCMQNRGGYDELVEPREDCVQNQFGFCDLGIGCVDKRSQDNDLKVTLKEDCFSEKVENLEQNNVSSGSPHVIFEASVKFGHPSGVEEIKPFSVGCSSPQPDMPLWKTMEDVPAAVMPVNDGPLDKGQDVEGEIVHPEDVDGKKMCASGNDIVPSDMMLKDGYEINNSVVISGGDLAETDALLNFDGDAIDKSCYESVNSLLLNSPNDVHEDDTSKTKEHETLVSDMCPGTLEAATYSSKLDEVPDQQSHSGHTEQLYSGHPEINVPSSASVSNPHSPELNDEGCCMLNSEDPEIPCNDDVLLAKAFAPQECHKVGSDQASSFANQNDSKEELSLMQTEDNLAQCFTAPKMVGLDLLSESSQAAKSEFHDGQCHVISRQAQNSLVDPYRFKTSHAFPNSAANGATKEEPSDECNTKDISTYAEASSIVDSVLEAEANKTTFDQIEYGSEDDVPSFSDLEAMILEMDLCPDESDSFIRSEVSRYQDEHTRKTLIRLEQCARSAMQRATTSRGALAVLYGRHMKHYIKETEVVLGRATMDVDVDIDLGREGRANKISRRQAIIKMEGDGSFSLKNLGKSSIFLNGKEVSTGQLMGLVSSSLIEIRDMAFVFEINQNSVKRHLAKITPKKQEKKTAFDFPEEPKKVLHE